MKKLIIQLIKFGIVGVIATIIDFGVLILLKEIFNVNVLVASGFAFAVSVVVNYILSMTYVFKGGNGSKIKEFIVFVLLSAGGLLINEIIMWIGTETFNIYYIWIKIFSCIFVLLYNFVTRKIFLEKN